jgi:hypothetical protein
MTIRRRFLIFDENGHIRERIVHWTTEPGLKKLNGKFQLNAPANDRAFKCLEWVLNGWLTGYPWKRLSWNQFTTRVCQILNEFDLPRSAYRTSPCHGLIDILSFSELFQAMPIESEHHQALYYSSSLNLNFLFLVTSRVVQPKGNRFQNECTQTFEMSAMDQLHRFETLRSHLNLDRAMKVSLFDGNVIWNDRTEIRLRRQKSDSGREEWHQFGGIQFEGMRVIQSAGGNSLQLITDNAVDKECWCDMFWITEEW